MYTVGIDEVGRGCWAGPLLAAAVVLPENYDIPGLNDSKKLSPAQRRRLDAEIRLQAVAIGVGWVWPEAIDTSGITAAVKSAMGQAYTELLAQLPRVSARDDLLGFMDSKDIPDVVIDGNYNFLPEVAGARTMIGADGLIPAVSAASIIAKVARDNYMATTAAREYPQYGFASHVGYGTAAHIAALKMYGVTAIHRKSYKPIKQLLLQSDA